TLGSTFYGGDVSIYRDTGSGIYGPSYIACSAYSVYATFFAQAGTTYYLQGGAPCCGVYGSLRLTVEQVPPPQPVARFYYYPNDPSTFDTVQFSDQSADSGQVGIGAWAWNFGDGATASSSYPTHTYAADGNYNVQLT